MLPSAFVAPRPLSLLCGGGVASEERKGARVDTHVHSHTIFSFLNQDES